MPRRYRPAKREIVPDPRYHSENVARLINKIMVKGKKSVAERVVYTAFDIIEKRTGKPGVDVFEQALRNAMPVVEVRPRRVGGATYQVPLEVPSFRRRSLGLRWLVQFARQRPGKSMAEKLAAELMDAANNQGGAIKKRDDTHRMAEANRAFAHYRW